MKIEFEPQSHIYRIDGDVWESVTQLLHAAGFGTEYNALAPDIKAAALRRGHFVHAATEQIDAGEFDEENLERFPSVAGYIRAYMLFLERENFEPTLIERIVAHPRMRYAGRIDRCGFVGAARTLATIDLKTGAAPRWVGLQLKGYTEAIPYLEDYQFANRPHVPLVVELHADGSYSLPSVIPVTAAQWAATVIVARLRRQFYGDRA